MYDQILRNKRATVLLVAGLFVLYAGAGVMITGLLALTQYTGFTNWGLLLFISVGGSALVTGGHFAYAYFRGGQSILDVAGAHLVSQEQFSQLYNVVEEMAVAAGLSRPGIYVVNDEAPNAFAVGRSARYSDIVVTTGLLSLLNRDELQGVIAHEMAHIRNDDTRLMTLVTTLMGPALRASEERARKAEMSQAERTQHTIEAIVGVRRRSRERSILGDIIVRALGMAVSRQREYLADATAALLTRYPDALADALEKIAASPHRLRAGRALLYLFIVNPEETRIVAGSGNDRGDWSPDEGVEHIAGLRVRIGHWYRTHPPLHERIQRLRGMGLNRAEGMGDGGQGRGIGDRESAVDGGIGFARMDSSGLVGAPPESVARPTRTFEPVIAAADPQPLALNPQPPTCPRCRAELLKLRIAGRSALGCGQCGGAWMHGAEFQHLLSTQPSALDAADRYFPNLIGSGWDLVNARSCALCATTLITCVTREPIRVTLDRCPDCGGLWFDDGELSALAWAARRRG